MKKIYKILILIIWLVLITWLVYATVTIAKNNKSAKLPWQWTKLFDTAHNVWNWINWDTVEWESRFNNNWNGTISDTITGLIWQQVASTTEQTACKIYDTNSFTDTDCNDWNVWDDCNWCAAKSYCAGLNLWWYTDWRLPNLKELQSIVDLSKYNSSIDTTYFTAYNYGYYWSSTTGAMYTSYAWYVNFYFGTTNYYPKATNAYVRCVH